MKLAALIATALFALPALATPNELVVDYIHKISPEDCKKLSQRGDNLSVHYTGTLHSNGNKFDSSRDRDQPFTLKVGHGQVIEGWDKGLIGLCEGERVKLTIPSRMAYKERGFGNVIPPNSALVFDVELLAILNERDEL